jgi:hypothetical protein
MTMISTTDSCWAFNRLVSSAIALMILCAAGCSDSPATTPTATASVPILLEPQSQAFVKQNDPATGCRQDPVWGFGYQVTFTWTAVRGATGYRIFIIHPQAFAPLVDEIVSGTQYDRRRCTEILGFESGWQWKVRAVLPSGQEGDWSETRTINFTRGFPE